MQCGHELGASRTCPGCGTTVPVEPPPAPQQPRPGIRYPLFADEVDTVNVTTSGHVLTTPVRDPLAAPPEAPTQMRLPPVSVMPRRRATPAVWVTLTAFVLGVLAVGAWMLLHGGSSSDGQRADASHSAGSAGASDVASNAAASAPVTRAPGVDTAGNTTSYAASNMIDGDPHTAWEMEGDGTGKVLTFTLAKRTQLSQVGLVNGYAKTGTEGGTSLDWYAGNRRVLRVEWLFDDGSTVTQDLRETTAMQTTAVRVTTKTVRLRLIEVSAQGTGPAGRNMTPISEVLLSGQPG
ncbi:hypothetical protein JCM18899A_12010 [Nocardioides sp. AN3]